MNTDSLRASWAQVEALGDLAAKHFYATLFLLAPDTREMFPHSMSGQNDKLLAALGHVVSNVDQPHVLGAFATQLGADHRRFAVTERHYSLVGQALLSTLERFLGHGWTRQLREDWQAAYEAVAGLMLGGAAKAAQTNPPWWDCKVIDVRRPNAEMLVFTVLPDYLIDYRAGQSMPVQGPRRDGWRYLSPANAPRYDGTIEFHLRAVGPVSTGLVRHLQPGDQLQVGAPIGAGLTEYGCSSKDLVMVAGGTGVAPLRAVIEAMDRDGPRRTSLVYGAATSVGLYEHPNLTAMAARTDWLTYIPTVQAGSWWGGRTGTAIEVALSATDWHLADIMICGSPGMVAASIGLLHQHGVPPNRIYTERHTNTVYPPLAAADATRGGVR